jgi:hypothetical protein
MSEIKLRYVGRGQFYSGVPARDLTAADLAQLAEPTRLTVLRGNLYQAIAPELDLPAQELLLAAGYRSREAVAAATDTDLLAITGIGKKRLEQIRAALAGNGGGE